MLRIPPLVTLLLFLFPAAALGQGSPTWQQHVRYEMDVTLLADRHQLEGTQRLTYTNNSPDTLRQVFYHLYFNAFQPTSMMAERNRHLPDPDSRVVPRIFNLGPDEIGYHRIRSLTQNGEPVAFEIHDTVMRVDLAAPILPGESTVFEMHFRSQVPLQTRRSGRDNLEGIDYSMTQWYPKMAGYDERGWHADPYVGREFYAPFGTFDVRITAPSAYVLGGTGVVQNPGEVGHGYGGIDAPTSSNGDSLTWHFLAEQVHDFAWVADPDYIHERFVDNRGITYHLLYQPDVAERWQPMSYWVPALIQFFSDAYGPYPYPQFTVAQGGDGGMEYPMVNLITGRRSPRSLLRVTAHEAAHEWFYGVLATNEADYAWMDEGFTSYATTEGVAHVLGQANPNHQNAFLNVLFAKDAGFFERLNTPADWFTTNAAYGIAAYSGGEMLVEMLQYVISPELRDAWLREYYRRFTFRHPNPYDIEKIAEDVSGLRLDWYFEQFTNTTRTLDYAVADVDTEQLGAGRYRNRIELRREDEVVMPVDLRLTYADGSTQWINIPLNIMQGHKPVPDDWIVAEPWFWTFPDYTLELEGSQRVVSAEIDPEGLTPDRNRLNNTARFPVAFALLEPPQASWFHYSVGWRPLAQYAHDFGAGVGLQARGTYLFDDHRMEAMVKVWPQVLASGGDEPALRDEQPAFCDGAPDAPPCQDPDVSFFDGIDYVLRYTGDVEAFGEDAQVSVSAQKHLGLMENQLTFEKSLSSFFSDTDQRLSVSLIHQFAPSNRIFPADASAAFLYENGFPTLFNDTHFASVRLAYRIADGRDHFEVAAEAGGSVNTSDLVEHSLSATRFSVTAAKSAPLGPLEGLASFQFGMGPQDLAPHKRFRLGAASFEDRWRNDAFRSVAAAFAEPRGEAHLVALRTPGPVAYLLSGLEGDPDEYLAVGGFPPARSILAGSLSLSAQPLPRSRWLGPLRLEAFSGIGTLWDIGTLWNERLFFSFDDDSDDLGRFIADAGLGVSYDVSTLRPLQNWVQQSDVLSTLRITAKFPLWASDPELIEADQDPLAFRWLLGIQTDL